MRLNHYSLFFSLISSSCVSEFLSKASPKISPREAPESFDPYCLIASFSSEIWRALIDKVTLRDFLSKLIIFASTFCPTSNLVEYIKSFNIPVICFPRNIKNYKKFCELVNPSAVNIDYEVDPKIAFKEIKIPIQGGLDPKILLGDKEQLKKEANKYLEIFKDHPYIFNLGHGVLPETDPNMVDYLVKLIKDFKWKIIRKLIMEKQEWF